MKSTKLIGILILIWLCNPAFGQGSLAGLKGTISLGGAFSSYIQQNPTMDNTALEKKTALQFRPHATAELFFRERFGLRLGLGYTQLSAWVNIQDLFIPEIPIIPVSNGFLDTQEQLANILISTRFYSHKIQKPLRFFAEVGVNGNIRLSATQQYALHTDPEKRQQVEESSFGPSPFGLSLLLGTGIQGRFLKNWGLELGGNALIFNNFIFEGQASWVRYF